MIVSIGNYIDKTGAADGLDWCCQCALVVGALKIPDVSAHSVSVHLFG